MQVSITMVNKQRLSDGVICRTVINFSNVKYFFFSFPRFEGIKFDWIDSGGPRADVLQKVTLEIKSQDDCKRSFGSKAPGGIVDHFICAAAPRKDSCAVNSLNEHSMYS